MVKRTGCNPKVPRLDSYRIYSHATTHSPLSSSYELLSQRAATVYIFTYHRSLDLYIIRSSLGSSQSESDQIGPDVRDRRISKHYLRVVHARPRPAYVLYIPAGKLLTYMVCLQASRHQLSFCVQLARSSTLDEGSSRWGGQLERNGLRWKDHQRFFRFDLFPKRSWKKYDSLVDSIGKYQSCHARVCRRIGFPLFLPNTGGRIVGIKFL
jgi:hypothetical protein